MSGPSGQEGIAMGHPVSRLDNVNRESLQSGEWTARRSESRATSSLFKLGEDEDERGITGQFIGAFYVFNGLMWLLGIALVALVLSQIVGDGAQAFFKGTLVISYGCTSTGILIVIIGIIGCFSGVKRTFKIVLSYIILATLLLFLEIALTIYLYITLNGGIDEVVSTLWNELAANLKIVLQHQFSCCGLVTYADEYETLQDALQEASCAANETTVYDGCQEPLSTFISSNLWVIGIVFGCTIVIQLIATFMSCSFAGKIADRDQAADMLAHEPPRSHRPLTLRPNSVAPMEDVEEADEVATAQETPGGPPPVIPSTVSPKPSRSKRTTRLGTRQEQSRQCNSDPPKNSSANDSIESGSEEELQDFSDHDSVDALPTLTHTPGAYGGTGRKAAGTKVSSPHVSIPVEPHPVTAPTSKKAISTAAVRKTVPLEEVPREQLLEEGYQEDFQPKAESFMPRVMERIVNWLKKGVTQGERRPRICEIENDW